MTRKVFISTAIPYVNGEPHAGHSLEYVQTDVLARYFRQKYGEENVLALTGTDENALKNVLAAEIAGKSTQEYVDEKSESFRELNQVLDLSFDDFIRTTEQRHVEGAQKMWRAFDPKDIYQDEYEGLYCVGCEEFKTKDELVDGLCPEHKKKPEVVNENNYFFKLSNYQQQIEDLITNDTIKITPEKSKNEVLGFVKQGLKDFSISRSIERSGGWGIDVPGDSNQKMYVWVDALSNYITALGYGNDGKLYHEFWDNPESIRLHVIGKGIVKFHALYWIGMLLSAKLPLPTHEFVHGYVTVEGNKIGKSLGNAIHPKEIVGKYGVDAFRYYLLREIPSYGDGDFSWSRMHDVYTADLVNGIGNLAARVAAMIAKAELVIPDEKLEMSKHVEAHLDQYRFDEAMADIMSRVRRADMLISEKKVWTLTGLERDEILTTLAKLIRQIAIDLMPMMPHTAELLMSQYATNKIIKTEALFPRISV